MKLKIDFELLKKNWYRLIPWMVIIAAIVYNISFIMGVGRTLVDGDMSTEMILADLLNKEHSILSENWFYSTELHVFNIQWFFRTGLLLFPHNWAAARAFAMFMLMALLVILWMIIGRITGETYLATWVATISLLPFSPFYQYYCTFGGFYWLHHVYTLFGIVLVLSAYRKKALYMGLFFLVGIMTGLNGVRTLMTFFAPMLLAAFLMLILRVRTDKISEWKSLWSKAQYEISLLIMAVIGTLGSGIGFIISTKILSRKYPYESFIDLNLVPYSFRAEIMNFIYMFGYQFKADLPVFSAEGISSVLGILVGFAVVFCAIRLMIRYRQLDSKIQFLTLLSVCAIVVTDLVLCYGTNYQTYYWVPMFPYAFMLIYLEISTEDLCLPGVKYVIPICIACIMALSSVFTVRNAVATPKHGDPRLYNLTQWLVDMGYDKGVCGNSFWRSQIITEMSDGKIEIWNAGVSEDGILHWLQQKDHATIYPEGRHFLLLDGDYNTTCEDERVIRGGGVCVYGDDYYSVYEFNDSSWIPNVPQ